MTVVTAYSYAGTVQKVVDGDTLDLLLDLGFSTFRRERVRLLGVNTPEMNAQEGKAARWWVMRWLIDHAPDGRVQVLTRKPDDKDKYGRYLAEILAPDKASLTVDLLKADIAAPYLMGP